MPAAMRSAALRRAWARADIPPFLKQPRDPAGERSGLPGSPESTKLARSSRASCVSSLYWPKRWPDRAAIGRAPGTNPVGHVRGRFRGRLPFHDEAKRVAQRQPEERAGDGIGVGRHSNKICGPVIVRAGYPG